MSDTNIPLPRDDEQEEAENARLDAEAFADIEAGRVVPHAEVVKWLESWGTENELPPPRPRPR